MMLVESSNFQAFGDDGFCLGSLVASCFWRFASHAFVPSLVRYGRPFLQEISIPVPDVRTERVLLNHRLRLDDPTLSSVHGALLFFFNSPIFQE